MPRHEGTKAQRHEGLRGFRPAFTMVELIVVIVVLALLIAIIAGVGGRVFYQQRLATTKQVMQNVKLAIDDFVNKDPLATTYNRRGQESFGAYPPYMLANRATANTVAATLDTDNLQGTYVLENRLHRDLGNRAGLVTNWVSIRSSVNAFGYEPWTDDNRALYVYLKAFVPGSVARVGDAYLKPLVDPKVLASDPTTREYVNPTGTGPAPGTTGSNWVDVLGFHDAWGVPLDYMLYVKCEWGPRKNADGSSASPGYRITERRAVLRSRGIDREKYDAWRAAAGSQSAQDALSPPSSWIYTEELPQPFADADSDNGQFGTNPAAPGAGDGWLRAVAGRFMPDYQEDYKYRPN